MIISYREDVKETEKHIEQRFVYFVFLYIPSKCEQVDVFYPNFLFVPSSNCSYIIRQLSQQLRSHHPEIVLLDMYGFIQKTFLLLH